MFISPSKFEDPKIILDDYNYNAILDIDWIYMKLNNYKEYNVNK